jgi:hypothetical protein
VVPLVYIFFIQPDAYLETGGRPYWLLALVLPFSRSDITHGLNRRCDITWNGIASIPLLPSKLGGKVFYPSSSFSTNANRIGSRTSTSKSTELLGDKQ